LPKRLPAQRGCQHACPTIPFHVYTFYPINWEFTGVLGVVLYHNILVGMWVSQHRVVLADPPTIPIAPAAL
jgi:hypothetical protein